jgi:hypothetical protein
MGKIPAEPEFISSELLQALNTPSDSSMPIIIQNFFFINNSIFVIPLL